MKTLPSLFAARAGQTPQRVAVVDGAETLTFRQLDRRAERLAGTLRLAGIGPESLVGVMVAPSIDLIVAVLGVWKAGGAYVPIDVESPADRVAFVLRDAAASVAIVDEARRPLLPAGVVAVSAKDEGEANAPDAYDRPAAARPDHLAYVIYTSGSTGRPKGVLVEHRSVVSLLQAADELFDFGPDDVWTLCHSLAFDFSVWEIWGALTSGGRLVIVPRAIARSADDLRALIAHEGVTVLSQTPTAFMELMRADQAHLDAWSRTLRYVIFGGEALAYSRLRPWFAAHGHEPVRLINMYGITETTVHVTFRPVTEMDARNALGSFIGQAIPGWRIHVLDDALRPVPEGQAGELCVAGAGVARGYLNRPDLQAARFVPDPFSEAPGAMMYRSGDRGRLTPDGDIEYLGRADGQVKLRGFRIELGEIEAVLGDHPGVAQAVAVLCDDRHGDKQLVGYWVSASDTSVTTSQLRTHLSARLPAHMVPSVLMPLARLPRTVNGKLDRAALPAPAGERPDLPVGFTAPRTGLEVDLAEVWTEVLDIDLIGIHDNFFALGGHSLAAARIAARLRGRGIGISLREVFDHPTIARLAARATRADGALETRDGPDPIPAEDHGRAMPLSPAQSGLWFLQQGLGWTRAYTLAEAWMLRGPLALDALRRAMTAIVKRHSPLRTRFGLEQGVPCQTVSPAAPLDIAVHDLSVLPDTERSAAANARALRLAEWPFDLSGDILLRAEVVRLEEHAHVLTITVHHIVSDAWSQRVFHRELSALYCAFRAEGPDPLPALPTQYADATAVQRQHLTPDRVASLHEFWAAELAGLPPLDLPTDRARPHGPSDLGDECRSTVPPELAEALRRLAHEEQSTLQMVLMAAYQLLVGFYSGQRDFAVATATAGRDRTEVEPLIGLFINTLVIRADLSGNPTVREVIRDVRRRSLDAYAHQDLPFDQLVARLRPVRDPHRVPLAQAFFQLLEMDGDSLALDGLEVTALPLRAQRARFDVEVTVVPADGGLRVGIVFRSDVFDRSTMERFGRHYVDVLRALVHDPDVPLDRLSWLADDERHQQLAVWSGAGATVWTHATVTSLIADQCAGRPDAWAATIGGHRLTYRYLGTRASRVAERLRAAGVARHDRVAVCLDRSVDLVVAMVGILGAGAAYVPLDRQYPPERLRLMLRDAGADTVVADSSCPAAVREAVTHVVGMDEGEPERAAIGAVAFTDAAPADVAYVMYTSGSTGRPNGVAVPHRAVVRLVRDTEYVRFEPGDRVAFAASPSFDAATFEVWGALLNGAEVVGLDSNTVTSPSALAEAIADHGITVMFLTTSLFHQIAGLAPHVFAPLRYLVVGGEALDAAATRAVLAAGPPAHLVNGYGPTENTTFSTTFDIVPQNDVPDPVPIGRPVTGTTCYVLDECRRLLPTGGVGELYVGGQGLADGYVNQPVLTAERFVEHPFEPGQRLYRTGDLARWRPDGALIFMGRRDRQIKLRGHRIELADIETALRTHAAVRQCAVLVRGADASRRLVAYWTTGDPGEDEESANRAVLARLRTLLPEYMLPTAIVRVPALPTTANGKLDLSALPDPREVAAGTRRRLSEREAALVAIWAEALDRPTIGVDENFFEAGGSSLLAMTVAARIEARCGFSFPAMGLFTHPTIALIASLWDGAATERLSRTVFEVRRGGARPPLYFPPGLLGEPAAIERIIDQLPDDQPVFVIKLPSMKATDATSMESIASRCAAELTAAQPSGPFCLAGYSFSGLLAVEMAIQLRASGRDVTQVVVIDSGPGLPAARTVKDRAIAAGLFLQNLPRWIWNDLRDAHTSAGRIRLWRSIRKLAKQLTGRSGGVLSIDDVLDATTWPREMVEQANAGLRALAAYRHRPYDGRLALLRARTWPLFHGHGRDAGWRQYAQGGLDIVDVPGDHHTITCEPHVRALGLALRRALDFCVSTEAPDGRIRALPSPSPPANASLSLD